MLSAAKTEMGKVVQTVTVVVANTICNHFACGNHVVIADNNKIVKMDETTNVNCWYPMGDQYMRITPMLGLVMFTNIGANRL